MSELKAVAKVADFQSVEGESNQIIALISRAASDPIVNVDKLEKLLEMRERVIAREAKAAFDAAMAEMQPELPSVGRRGEIKNKAGGVQSKYALWEDVNDAIKPVLQKHGFSLQFKTEVVDHITVTGILAHRGGHREETTIRLPHDSSGSKNNVQAIGSSVSYGKRYTAGALLNLTSHGEDNDAAHDGEEDFDTTPWTDDIQAATTQDALNAIGVKLKAAKGVPPGSLTLIRNAWAGQAKRIKEAKNATA